MHFLLSRFAQEGLNKRVFTEEDVYRICRRERIRLVENLPLSVPGWYWKFKGKPQIYIDSRISSRSIKWLHVALHELAHHFLHAATYTNAAFFYCDRHDRPSKEHFEAEAFSVLALVPISELEKLLKEEIEKGSYQEKLIESRLKILDLYGI